mgnify:CR=1 FL=1
MDSPRVGFGETTAQRAFLPPQGVPSVLFPVSDERPRDDPSTLGRDAPWRLTTGKFSLQHGDDRRLRAAPSIDGLPGSTIRGRRYRKRRFLLIPDPPLSLQPGQQVSRSDGDNRREWEGMETSASKAGEVPGHERGNGNRRGLSFSLLSIAGSSSGDLEGMKRFETTLQGAYGIRESRWEGCRLPGRFGFRLCSPAPAG